MVAFVDDVIAIAQQAGQAIMEIYQTDFKQYEKSDTSPLTEADLAAHHIIVDGLKKMSSYPCLSEESGEADGVDWQQRKDWGIYWLIDPLDGTKEFINKNDEFTVNIALIENGKAVLGVVYCPPLDRLYFAEQSMGAFRQDGLQPAQKISVADAPKESEVWKIVGSRRHGAEALEKFAEQLGDVETVSMGSSLKLCLVAEGAAHLYPRLALTCEWDTGAAQAIVEIAGGQVLAPTKTSDELLPLMYGQKEELLNPFFIVCGPVSEKWQSTFISLSK
ncbi:3'(2'),5'-bisphosphate nucleotidase [Pelagibaculum spongiae]|uniref:3'(2'),5'-bisphosphate nucleotidase CysQ n=2 Tax=Pelagibaculum spongiae TaxID=2080658 RepID=A0A2V1H2J2_9GAMM|nr:3'(2'),5'-bisphosphate nucleotidase [Pelagibaculum spongiae]